VRGLPFELRRIRVSLLWHLVDVRSMERVGRSLMRKLPLRRARRRAVSPSLGVRSRYGRHRIRAVQRKLARRVQHNGQHASRPTGRKGGAPCLHLWMT
jgi:hypothetical protein